MRIEGPAGVSRMAEFQERVAKSEMFAKHLSGDIKQATTQVSNSNEVMHRSQ